MTNFDFLTREPVTLMSEGKTHYTSLTGSILSIVMVLFIFLYFVMRVGSVGRIEDAAITKTLQDRYFNNGNSYNEGDQEISFGDAGFNIALGLGSFSDSPPDFDAI